MQRTYIRIQRKKGSAMTKQKQQQIYWVAVVGMLIVLLGSTLIKSNIIQIVGLAVVAGAFIYLWRANKKKSPEIKK